MLRTVENLLLETVAWEQFACRAPRSSVLAASDGEPPVGIASSPSFLVWNSYSVSSRAMNNQAAYTIVTACGRGGLE